MAHEFAGNRYEKMRYRRCGVSGLKLPEISLGAWETFGGYRDAAVAKQCLFRAFDLRITHFDLANNYGTPLGNAEVVCGQIIRDMPRDELVISSKAGFYMWPGPYGDWGSRKYIISSCDQSLKRMGLEYLDIFYHHRPDPETPIEETLSALDQLVRQGKAIYVGVSNYNGAQFAEAVRVGEALGLTRILIHQAYYNMLGRGIETDLLPHTEKTNTGVIAFRPLASGRLTDKYLGGAVPSNSRAAQRWGKKSDEEVLEPAQQTAVERLNELAKDRGQTLAQMALAWILRLPTITSALIGASSVKQIEENVAALENTQFSEDELRRVDELTGMV